MRDSPGRFLFPTDGKRALPGVLGSGLEALLQKEALLCTSPDGRPVCFSFRPSPSLLRVSGCSWPRDTCTRLVMAHPQLKQTGMLHIGGARGGEGTGAAGRSMPSADLGGPRLVRPEVTRQRREEVQKRELELLAF